MALTAEEFKELRAMFNDLADDPHGGSIVYSTLGPLVSHSRSVLSIFENIEPSKRRPSTLFAAVHYLILKGTDHPLQHIFEKPESEVSLENVGPIFIDFCNEYSDEIEQVTRHRTVQTNEVNRAVGFLPALMEVARQAGKPLALVELGAAAGLNLLFDRFRYDYNGVSVIGSQGAGVRLSTQIRNNGPKLDAVAPVVDFRVGVDTEPVRIEDENDELWMRACVWVGEVARDQRLTAAMTLADREWPDVEEGDALSDLTDILYDIDEDLSLVIYNSWMMTWWPPADQQKLAEILTEFSNERDIWWITFEGEDKVPGIPKLITVPPDAGVLGLQHLTQGTGTAKVLAHMHHHGAWLEWLDTDTQA